MPGGVSPFSIVFKARSRRCRAMMMPLSVETRFSLVRSTIGPMQDASLQESMGPIVDRTKENLVSTDNGIIMARHRLLRALKTMEKGDTPPGIAAEHQHVRSAAVVLPPDKHFKDAAKEALVVQTGKEHVTV